MVDDRLSLAVEHTDGRTTRWSFDEVDGKNIPTDLSFGTKIPGGYEQMQCSLMRRLDQDHPDLDPFDTVTVYGPGGRIAYQGRHVQFPRSHGDSFSITPGAVGWSSHLRDDSSFQEVYVDRNLSAWGPMSAAREMVVLTGGHRISGQMETIPDAAGNPGVRLLMDRLVNTAVTSIQHLESFYRSPVPIHKLYYDVITHGLGVGVGWNVETFMSPDDQFVSFVSNTVSTGAAGSGYHTNPAGLSSTDKAAMVRHRYVNTFTGDGMWVSHWRRLAVYGTHGLTGYGTDPVGFHASDIVADVVGRAAPLLSFTTGADGSIEPSTFVIPHAAYTQPVTADYVVSDVNKYELNDWGVYDNLEVFYRRPDPDRLCWEARLSDGAQMSADGLAAEQVINGVIVTYTDVSGITKTVGPPSGLSGPVDATDDALQDTSTSNPVNTHGIPAKPDTLVLSFPTTQEGAIQIGTVYLAERSLATRRGSLTLNGVVRHPSEGPVPVWRVRAGDWIRVTDLNGENATVQRKIISTSYSHASRSITLELDNTPAKLSAILERVGIQTGIATGGGF